MAKRKGRRSSRSSRSARRSGGATSTRAAPQVTETRSAAKEPDFASEYRYVLGDLKRIGVLAAGMFATLVVLALVIR
jgi:hypothetical protein